MALLENCSISRLCFDYRFRKRFPIGCNGFYFDPDADARNFPVFGFGSLLRSAERIGPRLGGVFGLLWAAGMRPKFFKKSFLGEPTGSRSNRQRRKWSLTFVGGGVRKWSKKKDRKTFARSLMGKSTLILRTTFVKRNDVH